MSKKYRPIFSVKIVRFHVDFGPDSLFERVRYKMKDIHTLFLDGKHFKKRLSERNIPQNVMDKMLNFDINQWVLKTAEVRIDRGKFVNSTWEVICDNKPYWVTIGLGNYIKTIVQKNSSGKDKCIREGVYYEFVKSVNKKLMDDEQLQ